MMTRVALGLAVALAVVAGAWVLTGHKPAETGFSPGCQFREMTGWHCPGCGGTRAAHALLHLDFGTAMARNALLVVALPVVAALVAMVGGARVLGQRYRGPRVRVPLTCAWWLPAIVVSFWVLRNLPGWPFSLLAP